MSWGSNRTAEWLEADGLGGFASGTAAGIRSRRYHALLLTASTPPTGRFVLVNGLEVRAQTPEGEFALSSQLYSPGIVHPDEVTRISGFEWEPWPRWEFLLGNGTRLEHEVFVPKGAPVVVLSWRLKGTGKGVRLTARPLISGRDPHALHRENPAFRFDYETLKGGGIRWHPYDGVPGVVALGNGTYEHHPDWYRNFLYEEERARGLDCIEDLASPGMFRWDLSSSEAFLLLGAEGAELESFLGASRGGPSPERIRSAERRRRSRFASPLHRAADAYLVRRGRGQTVIAGYPWFGDWGRDTFIGLRGLCLATGRLEEAGRILTEWATSVSEGMLPNRFPDRGHTPEYNSVDASLWFVVAVHEFLQAMSRESRKVTRGDEKALRGAVESILEGYAGGTRYGIHLDDDGLLAAGEPGVQLTWMDAKIGDWVVTPRIGKPVEVQALWLNALRAASVWSPRWSGLLGKGQRSFRQRFWHEAGGFLYDVVDADHQTGKNDPSFRPNQIFAVGGLPWNLLEGDRARRVVEAVERRLLTPLGLRSLAPGEPGYVPRYEGGVLERDGAYHQGTVWPWLLGPFVEAWVRVRGGTSEVKREARTRFLNPLLQHRNDAGLGHISEIADAEPPFTPRGCPFQAWSVGEALRISEGILREDLEAEAPAGRNRGRRMTPERGRTPKGSSRKRSRVTSPRRRAPTP